MSRVTWTEVQEFAEKVGGAYKGDPSIRGVYGIPRGGLVPAVMCSHILGVPLHMVPTVGDLIVDDISDSGETLMPYKLKGFKTATVLTVEGTITTPDLSLRTREDDWAIFPWEAWDRC